MLVAAKPTGQPQAAWVYDSSRRRAAVSSRHADSARLPQHEAGAPAVPAACGSGSGAVQPLPAACRWHKKAPA